MWADSWLREELKREHGISAPYPNPDRQSIKDIEIEVSWTQREIEEIIEYIKDCKQPISKWLENTLYWRQGKLKDLRRQLDTYK